jgi:hypothetical protein
MLGPDESPSIRWELPPNVMTRGGRFGPRRRPHPGRIDLGGWHPGMPYGPEAWDNYRRASSHY